MGALDQSFVMARLELQLLGFPAARLDGRAVDLGLRKGLGLLAYLADARGPVGREMLAGLLWPDLDGEAAGGRD
jgi:DNA-binding SARP family transcriptional activator